MTGWPEKYRPKVEKDSFIKNFPSKDKGIVYGAFDSDDVMAGYAYLTYTGENLNFNVLRTCPSSERDGVNAAIVDFILSDNETLLKAGHYICDGSRSVRHETGFQDYLEKYFGFRKAYCDLKIQYRKPLKGIIHVLYIFRKQLKKFDSNGFIHSINAVLEMEEIVRN